MTTNLEERLEWYDHNYRIGNALITDKQFDQLEKNLLRIDPVSYTHLTLPTIYSV